MASCFWKRNKWAAAAAIIIAATLCFILIPSTVESEPSRETELLWNTASGMMKETPEITMTFGTVYTGIINRKELEQLGNRLAGQFGITRSSLLEESGHAIYEGKTTLPGGAPLILRLAEMDSGDAYMLISLPFHSETDLIQIKEAQQRVEKQLNSQGISPEWRIMLRGEITPGLQGETIRTDGNLDQSKAESVLAQVAASLSASRLEAYENGQSRNVTLHSPYIETKIQSGDNTMNVQAAVHQHTETGAWTLTLATPVITSDF
ncbi:YwmB family TATA-box binding protein [Paenibacillus larvae]